MPSPSVSKLINSIAPETNQMRQSFEAQKTLGMGRLVVSRSCFVTERLRDIALGRLSTRAANRQFCIAAVGTKALLGFLALSKTEQPLLVLFYRSALRYRAAAIFP